MRSQKHRNAVVEGPEGRRDADERREDGGGPGNKLYKRTTHGAQEEAGGPRGPEHVVQAKYIRLVRDYAGGFTLRRALNRSFRMKRIGGSTAPATWVVCDEDESPEGSHGGLRIRGGLMCVVFVPLANRPATNARYIC